MAERFKSTRFKPGVSGNPKGRPRTAKFSEALRQIAAEINANGETGAEQLARHIFKKAIAGSARHAEMILDRCEGKVTIPLTVEAESPVAVVAAARQRVTNHGTSPPALPQPIEIPAAPPIAPAATPKPVAKSSSTTPAVPLKPEPLSDEARAQRFFDYTTGRVVR